MKDMMHYKGYYGSVHFDSDELFFYGKVEFIRALISYEATDAKGLYHAFQEAVEDYLALCHEQKLEPEVPFKGTFNIRLGQKLHREVAVAAAQRDVSINKFITDTLANAVHSH